MRILRWGLAGFVSMSICWAQDGADEAGVRVGFAHIRPEVSALAAYDSRAATLPDESAQSDTYAEGAVAAYLSNRDARYELLLRGTYGYRVYSDLDNLNDSFYDAGGSLASRKNPLKYGISAFVSKTLDYDVAIDPDSSGAPGSILTDGTSTRFSAKGNVGYEKKITDKITIKPGYDIWHYFQDFESRPDAEWQEHLVSLQLGYSTSEKMKYTLSGDYSLQVNDTEDGYIATVSVGAERQLTESTSWSASIGMSAADYELSGSDQGYISDVRAVWNITDKISAYVMGGNQFQPGYSGGSARMVYRLGYGGSWSVVERLVFRLEMLHDYQDSLGGGAPSPGTEEARYFFTGKLSYRIARDLNVVLGTRYVSDERPEDWAVVSLSAVYAF